MEKVKSFFSKIGESFKGIIDKVKGLGKKNKIILSVICAVILILLVIGILVLIFSSNKLVSAGNMNNRGMVDSSGGKTYFVYYNSNVENEEEFEKRGLYEMSGKNTKLLVNGDDIRSVNAIGNWVYYVTISPDDFHREVVKIRTNGKEKTVLVDDIEVDPQEDDISCDDMIVYKDKVYFIGTKNKLEVISKKGKDRKELGNEKVSSFQIVGDKIYFLTSDYELKKMSLSGKDTEEVSPVNMISFQVVKNQIYYINMNDNYLKRMDLDGENDEVVIEDIVGAYNITNGKLYYQKQRDDEGNIAIYKRELNKEDDEDTKVVDLKGEWTRICIDGNYIYYIDEIEDNFYYYTLFRVKTDGKDKEEIKV